MAASPETWPFDPAKSLDYTIQMFRMWERGRLRVIGWRAPLLLLIRNKAGLRGNRWDLRLTAQLLEAVQLTPAGARVDFV